MKCTCGHTKFAERKVTTTSIVDRWMAGSTEGGFGATAFGTSMGAGAGESGWGRFQLQYIRGQRILFCDSCNRERSRRDAGGFSLAGAVLLNGDLLVVGADFDLTGIGCLAARFVGPGGSYDVQLALTGLEVPVLDVTPLETVEALPAGAELVDTVLRAKDPRVTVSGDYTVSLVDVCNGVTTLLLDNVYLEAPVQIFHPKDANVFGAPKSWMRYGHHSLPVDQQVQGVADYVIPFDNCVAVLEYDARQGTLPSGQGWTFGGTGSVSNWGATEAKTLYMNKPGQSSYWTRVIVLDDVPESVHAYVSAIGTDPDDDGLFQLKVSYAEDGQTPHGGIIKLRSDGGGASINNLADNSSLAGIAPDRQWSSLGLSLVPGKGVLWQPDGHVRHTLAASGGAASDTELRAQFGGLDAANACKTFIQNVVVSTPGRFVRAGFQGFADTEEPILRLYLSAPTIGGDGTTARFKVKYTQSTDPYAVPGSEESVTLTLVAPNTLLEIPVSLPGCQANKPVRFTIERDWTHGTDTFEGTVFFHYATLRGV